MSHRPYPDPDRALRQLERHEPGCLRDPYAYEPQVRRLVDVLAEERDEGTDEARAAWR